MSYPQRDAPYKNTPKWVGRMKEAEKEDNTPFRQSDQEQPVFYKNDLSKEN
jgi:hypothetical protein